MDTVRRVLVVFKREGGREEADLAGFVLRDFVLGV